MSQYFTYSDISGRVPIDSLTSQPECKTCSKTSCYNTYDNVQGVSTSKHDYTASFALQDKDLKPNETQSCNISMIGCTPASLQNSDPYNITVKTTSKCNPSKASYFDINLPIVDGSLDKNKRESSRYYMSKSYNNNSRTAASYNTDMSLYPNYALSEKQKISLSAESVSKKLSFEGKMSSKLSSKESIKIPVPEIKLSVSPKPSVSKPSVSKPSVSKPSVSKPSVSTSNKIPLSAPINKKKAVDQFDIESYIKQLNL